MVIGYDGSRAFVSSRTGTENYSYQLLKNLAKIDHKNKYIVYLGTQGILLEVWPKNFQFKVLNWPRFWTQGGVALQTFIDKLDVLFIPAHTLPLVRKPGLKTVVTVHDLGSEYLPYMHQLKQRLYLSFMQRYQLKTATKIIAVSKATKEDLVKRIGIEPAKVEVVYEGYDEELFKPVKRDVLVNTLMHYNLQPKTYYLFVGTVQPRKNLERVIRAFSLIAPRLVTKNRSTRKSQSSSNSLVIAGSRGWLSDEIYKLPKKLGIEDKQSLRSGDLKVKFLGYVPDEKLSALYSGAIALVFPSLFEGFGLPILEAQACGTPVITSNISSMPEVAGKGAIYVDPYSIDGIVEGMSRIKNEELRMRLAREGFDNIKKFNWEKCASQTLKVFEGI